MIKMTLTTKDLTYSRLLDALRVAGRFENWECCPVCEKESGHYEGCVVEQVQSRQSSMFRIIGKVDYINALPTGVYTMIYAKDGRILDTHKVNELVASGDIEFVQSNGETHIKLWTDRTCPHCLDSTTPQPHGFPHVCEGGVSDDKP